MTDTNRDMTKKEAPVPEGVERTSQRRIYKPDVDIVERKNDTLLAADMPGVDERSLDITLEKNMLTIKGSVQPEIPQGYRQIYSEYPVGDYERVFTLSDEVDKGNIQATIKNGVLKLLLPKSTVAISRKISVKAGQ
ncbi:MAG: Hsp20/alpha crystallin family protein [Nitrospirota bacterium]